MDDIANEPQPQETTGPAPIGHNSKAASGPTVPTDGRPGPVRVSVDKIRIWSPISQQVADMQADDLKVEVEVLRASGQRMPVIVRRVEDDCYEAIGLAHLVQVVAEHNRLYPGDALEVDVRPTRLDDEAAYRLVAQEMEPRAEVSSYARGCFFSEAVTQFGTEQDAARHCRVSAPAISKNLDVYRAVSVLGDKVQVRRDVNQRDAMWLMSVVGRKPKGADAPDQEQRRAVLAALQELDIAPAKTIFAALRRSIKVDKPTKGVTVLTFEGREIGSMRAGKKGSPISFKITNAGDIEVDHVIEVVREALEATRR